MQLMKFTLTKGCNISKYFFLLLFFVMSSCSDHETRPFTGNKVDIYKKNKLSISKNPDVLLNKVLTNRYWAQKGGDRNHSISNFSFKFPLKKTFSKDTNQERSDYFPNLANPVVDEKNIYIFNTEGKISSINKSDFKLNWENVVFQDEPSFPNPGSIVVQVNKNDLYLHNGSNVIISVDKKNGKIIWKYENTFPFKGNITLNDKYLLVNDYDNNLLAFRDKKLIWKKKLGQSDKSIFTSIRPIVFDNKVINPAYNGLFHILSLDDGKLIYSDYLESNRNKTSILLDNDIVANPTIHENKLYILSHSGTLAAYDLNDLKPVWADQIGGINTPIVSGNSLFIIDNEGMLYAIDTANGHIIWEKQFATNIEEGFYFKDNKKVSFTGPFLLQNKLLLFSNKGTLHIINPNDGKIDKILKFDSLGSDPVFFENKLIILTYDGYLKIYK